MIIREKRAPLHLFHTITFLTPNSHTRVSYCFAFLFSSLFFCYGEFFDFASTLRLSGLHNTLGANRIKP